MITFVPETNAAFPKRDVSETLSRREVVVRLGSLVILLPASAWLSCGGSPAGGGDQTALTFTSSTDFGHSHTYRITLSELTNPPANGISKDTSSASGHVHVVQITQIELQSIQNGGMVTKTSTFYVDHSHVFQFTK